MATFGNIETDVEPLASLIRDHTETHALVTDSRETVEAVLEDYTSGAALAAIEKLRDLEAYLAVDLVIHIAKEEDVLFPALRGFSAEIDKVVVEMVEQHDEVRMRKAAIERVLAALDHAHDEVTDEALQLSEGLRRVQANGVTPEALAGLHDGVKRLDWILQGHFGDEEDDLFVPALELLTQEQFAELAERASALDAT
jgi:iron-sulfur cluster repair protein YtfE (RIC family)